MEPELHPIRLPLYSQLRRAVELAPMKSASREAWEQWLVGQVKRGLSQVELDFALSNGGWPEGDRLSRDDLLQFFAKLPSDICVMQLRSVQERSFEFIPVDMPMPKGDLPWQITNDSECAATIKWYLPAFGFYIASWPRSDLLGRRVEYLVLNRRGAIWRSKHLRTPRLLLFASLLSAQMWCIDHARRVVPITQHSTKPAQQFLKERLQCGKNYREWMITTPHSAPDPQFDERTHFDVDNLLLHLRTSIHEQLGRRFLLLEEIQSDRNQLIQELQHGTGAKIIDNPYQQHWVDLGVRIALLLAMRAGVDGVALSTGAMQEAVYGRENFGLASFYNNIVFGAAKKLARQLGLSASTAFVKAKQINYFVAAFDEISDENDKCFWHIYNERVERLPLNFDSEKEAEDYMKKHLAVSTIYTIPVFWVDQEQRADILQQGLPQLGGAITHSAGRGGHTTERDHHAIELSTRGRVNQ